jgi:hypothetical protein
MLTRYDKVATAMDAPPNGLQLKAEKRNLNITHIMQSSFHHTPDEDTHHLSKQPMTVAMNTVTSRDSGPMEHLQHSRNMGKELTAIQSASKIPDGENTRTVVGSVHQSVLSIYPGK